MRFNERLKLKFCAVLISAMIIFSFGCGGESGNGENGGERPSTYSISGQVTTNGAGSSGVTMTLSGTSTGTATTGSNGNYSFASLSNGSYTVTPSLSGYSFYPVYRNVNISGASETAADFIAESIQLEKPNTNNVYGEIILPDQSPIDLSSLKVQSFLTNVNVSSSGYFNDLQVIDEGGGQIVFVLDSSNNPIMVAYISTESVVNGTLNIGTREMALGLIAFNPYLMILSQDQRENILNQAELHADFNGLMGSIETALIQSPENALDYETYPYVYQTAMAIGLKILESYGDNPAATYGSYRILSTVGQEDDPHIDDPTGSNVTFVNPKMTFYGIQFEPPIDAVDDILLRGKESLIDLGWPPFVRTPPHEHNFNLGDGTFTITFYKGFNTSTSDWLNPWTAPGKATYANFLKIVAIGLDVFNAQWYIKLNDTTIFYLLHAVDPPSLYFDPSIGDALKTGNWLKMLRDTLNYLVVHWDEIAYWVYQEWPGDKTALALQSALRVANGVANAIPIAKILILGTKAANEYIPFGFDLVMAPSILEYNVKQTNGVLSEISSLVPPTAIFTFDPLQPYVGETVNFDASDSYDDVDPQYSLQVRWDFDGDDNWDTTWTSTKTATYSFSNKGTFRSVLQVKDTNNQIGITSHNIYISFIGIEWMPVPAGTFEMGDNFYEGYTNELPVHTVYLDAYYMSKYEVTFDQYDTFCNVTGRSKPYDEGWGRGDRPVILVSWNDAKAFCDWLSAKTGENIHLPTAAQWEKAARGTDQRRYPWGNDSPDSTFANYNFTGSPSPVGSSMPVGSYPLGVSPYGIYDMAGNVWEWCSDWYDIGYYSSSPTDNPQGPSSGSRRVHRGGGWGSSAYFIRSTYRNGRSPSFSNVDFGFRLCKD